MSRFRFDVCNVSSGRLYPGLYGVVFVISCRCVNRVCNLTYLFLFCVYGR